MADPTVVVPIPDQIVTRGEVISTSLRTYITDADAGDRLLYSFSGIPTGSGLSGDEDSGELTGTFTAADVAAVPFTVTVTARAESNSNIVSQPVSIPFDGEGTAPTVGATFYVSPSATGSGTGTLASPFTPSQAANINMAAIVPTPTTHVYVDWAIGNYDNQPYIPRYGGISASAMLINRVGAAGVARLRGPQSGSGINYAIELRSGIYAGLVYSAPYVGFERSSDRNFEVDGQVVFGTGGGEVGKGEAPETVAKVRRGILLETGGYSVDLDVTRTAGWAGVDVGQNAGGTYRINYTQHGTPFYPDGNDFGDQLWINQNNSQRHLIDGSASASRGWRTSGHGGPIIFGGQGAFRCQTVSNSWGAVSTFSNTNPDGNRGFQFTSRAAQQWHAYEIVINRNGQPQDSSFCELMKLEGTNNGIFDSVLRNSDHDAFNISSGSWSWHARGGRIAHCIFENIKGTIMDMRDYLDDASGGSSRINDYQIKNCIIRNIATATRTGWEDEILHIVCSTGVNWTNVIQMHGVTIEDATRTLDTLYVNITRGTSPPGKITLTAAMASYPANFSNITVTTDAGLDDAPLAATDILAEDLATYYTLNPADTTSLAQGVSLTLANGAAAGGSSVSLVVDDARWFDDPQDGNPPFGQQSAGFFVHIDGVGNRQYTAINYSTNTITLAAAANWADNAAINRKISSGSTPNRGYVR